MSFRVSRRQFLSGASAAAVTMAVSPHSAYGLLAPEALYPPMDLSYFDTPISLGPTQIHIGYAAITWNGRDRQAIEDISALGFRGIQLRSNAIGEFASPAELRDLLQKHNLTLVALSSGSLRVDSTSETEEIAKHVANAKFVHDVGGLYLQLIDQRPKNRQVTAADYKRSGQLLTEIGRRTADLGISLGYHNHMGALGERPAEVDQILQAADPRYVKLELDVAHYVAGGGDPTEAIEKYHDRLLFLHLKDVHNLPAAGNTDTNQRYRFVELGNGKVDFPAIIDKLHKVNFRGWVVVELDIVPESNRTPKQSAEISKKYIEERLGLTV
jgi:inosose dehydratase